MSPFFVAAARFLAGQFLALFCEPIVDVPSIPLYNRGFRFVLGGSMYAVIRSGGKQYRVAPGDTVKVETLPGKVGGAITFGDVVAVATDEKKLLTGADAAKAKVVGKIVSQGRHPKLTVFKYRCIKQYKIVRGHRQNYTAVEVSGIEL
jgi:large subunit ribosomal protein L21